MKKKIAHRTTQSLGYKKESTMTTQQRNRNKRLKTRETIRIGTWNIKSWTAKDQEIIIEIKQHNIDICGLSETKRKGKGSMKVDNYVLYYSGVKKEERAKAGVGILVHSKYEKLVEDINYVNESIIHLKLQLSNTKLNIFSVYAPDMSKSKDTREKFYINLQNEIRKMQSQEHVLILGDLNARVGDEPVPGIKQRFNENIINENGELLVNFCSQNIFRINNTFFPHDFKYKYTFGNSQGQQSMIDYVISSRHFMPCHILDIRTLNSANINSDHKLVLAKIRLNFKFSPKAKPIRIEKYNTESFEDETTRFLYETRLRNKILINSISEEDNANESWEKLKTNILSAANEALGKRTILTPNNRANKTPWFTDEVKTLALQKRKAFLEYKATKTQENKDKYIAERNMCNAKIRNLKESYWEKFTKNMEYDLYGAQKKMWRLLRNRKMEIQETVKINPISNAEWTNYFHQLYHEAPGVHISIPQTTNASRTEVNIDEVNDAIIKIKNRKAPGEDLITNEMLKYGGKKLHQQITNLFNIVIKTGEIPQGWKTSITIPIFKKGDKKDPQNYRGISLLQSTQKLFSKTLLGKLNSYLDTQEEQQGFRVNRSTVDAIYIIQQIVEKSIEFNAPAYMCFVDLTKAFDRVKLQDVLNNLAKQGVPADILTVIKNLNCDCKTKIRIDGKYINEVPCASGIRQGDSLSPILFNTIMDQIIKEVKSLDGYRLNNMSIPILCYADDAILIADSEDNLQRLLHKLVVTAKQFNMEVSREKTKSLVVAKNAIRCKLEIERTMIEQVMKFKYLGIEISSDRDIIKEVRERCMQGARIAGCIRDVVWWNKYMTTESKTRIYKTVIRPILTYGAEARAENAKTKQLLRTAEMQVLRSIVGKTRLDCIRNEVIRDETGVNDVVKFIRTRRRAWNDHVSRASDDRIIRIARDYIPYGKRGPGRPPKRWRESWISTSAEGQ